MQKKILYTRNLEPLSAGSKLANITLFNNQDEEIDLNSIKKNKVYISIPSFTNHVIMKEIVKLDSIFQPYEDIDFYLISNETTYTQKKLGGPKKLKKFQFLSDFKNRNFARYTGTYIYEISSLVKAIFIVNEYNEILYVQYFDDLYSNINSTQIIEILNTIE